MVKETQNQNKRHLEVMNHKLQLQHQVRPTILSDAVKAAGFALRAATALMSKEAAMACTEAVETVIREHYDECVLALCGESYAPQIQPTKRLRVIPVITSKHHAHF
jgi:ubiquinone biosynthesis monooxygenase Coq7